MLKTILVLAVNFVAAFCLSMLLSGMYFERELAQQKAAFTNTLLEQQNAFTEKARKMAPRAEVDGAINALRNRASLAQGAIIDSYVKVYCADHAHASAQEKQESMDIAAILSGLAMRAGVADVTLAEYRQCHH